MEEDFMYNLDIPQKDGTPGYVGMFFTMYLKVASTIQHPDFTKNTPISVFYLVNWIISAIPDEKIRKNIRDAIRLRRKELEQEYKSDGVQITEKVKDHILVTSVLEEAGRITEYIDKFVGLSKENKIGWGVDKNKDIIIKGSAIDLKMKELEEQLSMKDTEIKILRSRLNEDCKV